MMRPPLKTTPEFHYSFGPLLSVLFMAYGTLVDTGFFPPYLISRFFLREVERMILDVPSAKFRIPDTGNPQHN